MADRRPGVLTRIARKLQLAQALACYFLSQISSGARRKRFLARAEALDPSSAVSLVELLRRGDVGRGLKEAFGTVPPGLGASGDGSRILEDALFAVGISKIDPAQHPRASMALQFAAYLRSARGSASQLHQDLFVTHVLGDRRGDGFFVEFGAGDGIELSNTLRLERDLGWNGILSEPNPAHAPALRSNRRCAVSNLCVWSETGASVPFSVVDAVPSYSTISAFSRSDHIDRTASRSIAVRTISLNDLLRTHGAPRRIDYMSIDTEGSELPILEAFDFGAYDVSVWTIEHNFTPGRARIHDLLTARGYVRVLEEFSRWDDWYVRADLAADLRRRTGHGV